MEVNLENLIQNLLFYFLCAMQFLFLLLHMTYSTEIVDHNDILVFILQVVL